MTNEERARWRNDASLTLHEGRRLTPASRDLALYRHARHVKALLVALDEAEATIESLRST